MWRTALGLLLAVGCVGPAPDAWQWVGELPSGAPPGAAIADGGSILVVREQGEAVLFDAANMTAWPAGFWWSAFPGRSFARAGEEWQAASVQREGEWYSTPCGPGCHGDGYREKIVMRVYRPHPAGGEHVSGSPSPVEDGGLFHQDGVWHVLGGRDLNGTSSAQVWRLGPERASVAELLQPLAKPRVAWHAMLVYAVDDTSRDVHVVDLALRQTWRWEKFIPEGDRSGATLAAGPPGVCVFSIQQGDRIVTVCSDNGATRVYEQPEMVAAATWEAGSFWAFGARSSTENANIWRFTP